MSCLILNINDRECSDKDFGSGFCPKSPFILDIFDICISLFPSSSLVYAERIFSDSPEAKDIALS